MDLYWQVGEYISRKIESAAWGDGVVEQLTAHIARTHPTLRGFNRPNLFQMRQFDENYRTEEKSLATGETITLDPQPPDPQPRQAVRRAGVPPADGDTGADGERRSRGVQGHLPHRVPRKSNKPRESRGLSEVEVRRVELLTS